MEKFNEQYKDLINFLKKVDKDNHWHLKIVDEPKEKYLRDFIELNLKYMDDISVRNIDAFKYKYVDVELVKGLKFRKVLEKLNKKDIEFLWRKLHSLYVLAYNSCDMKKYIKHNYDNRSDLLNVIKSNKTIVENIMLSGHAIVEEGSSSSSEDESEEEENVPNFGDMMQQMSGLFKNFNETVVGEQVKGEQVSPSKPHNKEVNENENKKDDKKEEKKDKKEENMPDIFEGTLIGDLAKELSADIDPKDFGDINNPADLMKTLFSGGNGGENKLGDVINKVMSKLDGKMKSGELDQGKLLNEAQQMMGQMMGGAAGVAGGMDLAGLMGGLGLGLNGGGIKKKKHNRRGKKHMKK